MIGLDGEKMSKSRGNLVFVSGHDHLSPAHYRADGIFWPDLRGLVENDDIEVETIRVQVLAE